MKFYHTQKVTNQEKSVVGFPVWETKEQSDFSMGNLSEEIRGLE